MRVLVADDNQDHLFLIVRALRDMEGLHLEVEAVHDGQEALDFVRKQGRFVGRQTPHMILLDLKMPRRTGLDVLESLKSDPELRSIPVCILTSSDRPEDIQAAYALGTNSYVLKSSDPSGIRSEVRSLSDYWTATAVLPTPPA